MDAWREIFRLVEAERHAEARSALRVALTDRALSSGAWEIAGRLCFLARDHQGALDCFDAMAQRPEAAPRATMLAIQYAGRLGWSGDVRQRLRAMIAAEPTKLRWRLEEARLHTSARSWARAREALRDALALESENPRLWMELATVSSRAPLAGAHRADEVAEAVTHALGLKRVDRSDVAMLYAASEALTRVGRLSAAHELLERILELSPAEVAARIELAERALWRGDDDTAAEHAALADAWSPGELGGKRIMAGLAVRAGEFARAAAVEGDGDYRLHVWRAEANLRLGELERAHAELTRASMSADGFLPVAWLLRLLVSIRQDGPSTLTVRRYGEVRELLIAVDDGAAAIVREGRHEEAEALFERVLARLAGNRSTTPTWVERGEVERLPPITGERFASRRALERLRSEPPERAVEALSEVARRFAGHSLPDAHRGEVLVWLGRVEEARRALAEAIAIEPETRWAYIGLTMCDLLEGDAAAAYETSRAGVRRMHDTEGPAVHVHEGEALYRLGRLDEALTSLDRAIALHPSRLSARILRAMVHRAQGVDDESAALIEGAPGLFSDARRHATEDSTDALLESALRSMRGNRASRLITYVTDAGDLRFVPTRSARHRRPHDGDAEDLTWVRARLFRDRGPDRSRDEALAPDEVAAFIERGTVAIRNALSSDETRGWRERALQRIRLAPERFVQARGAPDPEANFDWAAFDPHRANWAAFSPDDPDTWPCPRFHVLGDGVRPLAEISARLWEAITQLLGGEERVATQAVGEHLVLNLYEDRGCAFPTPRTRGWHLDAPRPDMRVDNLTNGLVGILLLDDVASGQGATCVLPESIPHVARAIASAEGVDFVDRAGAGAASPAIAARCTEIVELTGRAGDVFLLHPLMLHTGSPNDAGRVRWMSNPVIHTVEALSFREPRSPVEEAIARAIRTDRATTVDGSGM